MSADAKVANELNAMIERLERESFEKWYVENCFDLFNHPFGCRDYVIQWKSWQARGRLIQPCRGARREGCSYLAPCGAICDNCGQVH